MAKIKYDNNSCPSHTDTLSGVGKKDSKVSEVEQRSWMSKAHPLWKHTHNASEFNGFSKLRDN